MSPAVGRRARARSLACALAVSWFAVACAPDGVDVEVLPPAPGPIAGADGEVAIGEQLARGPGEDLTDQAAAIGERPDDGVVDAATAEAMSGADDEPRVRIVQLRPLEMEVTFATSRPGTDGIYLVGKRGLIERLDDLPTAFELLTAGDRMTYERRPVLDIVDVTSHVVEEGALGLAFHPELDLAYVHHSDLEGTSVIAEYAIAADGTFVGSSRREVLRVAQPTNHHNGGGLAFGPDGHLYIALGDGSEHSDLDRVALDLRSPLGKLLRIDPTAGAWGPHRVPTDNPFVGTEGADWRVWASGLRNPFSFSFDEATGDLWLADVGQGQVEEVNNAEALGGLGAARGANFGWSAFEGDQPYNVDQRAPDAVAPTIVYRHDHGRCSVIGGRVARDTTVPRLEGWYLFGDWCTGELWAYRDGLEGSAEWIELGTVEQFVTIARSGAGDLYALGAKGALSLLVPEG